MRLLLDTGTFIWLTSAPQRLSEAARNALDDAGNDLYLSHASYWEIAEKCGTGQLRLPSSAQLWIKDRMKLHGIEEVAIMEDVIFSGAGLEAEGADTVDRLLAGQSLRGGFVVLSPDPVFTRLGARVLW